MMAHSFTPGPWVRSGDRGRVIEANGRKIAQASLFANWQPVSEQHIAHATADANARLIAAAPDLLAALIAADAEFEAQGYKPKTAPRVQIAAAIAKATGAA